MVTVDVLSPESPIWDESLELVDHDVYHLPGYVRAEAARLDGQPLGLRVKSRDRMLLLPLVLRPLPHGIKGRDAVSPYGYPGPLLTRAALADDGFVDEAGAAMVQLLRERGCCTVFVRGHPLATTSERLFAAFGRLRSVGPTVWVDLSLPPEERWARIDSKMKNRLRYNARAGVTVSVDETWDSLERFASLYLETMNRVGADASYYFDIDYFASLKKELAGHIHLMLARIRGVLVGAGLFTEAAGIVQFHLAGIKVLRGASPGAALVHFATAWAADRGNRVLHLGGGFGGAADSLLRFKTHFSPLRGSFYSWEIVLDGERVEHLTRLSAAGDGDGSTRSQAFFPPYRRL